MNLKKILVKNYKLLKDTVIDLNPDMNIFVGDNDSGKSTILEVLSILTTGKLNGVSFEKKLKANLFNREVRTQYVNEILLGKHPQPPKIILEAYFDGDSQYKGTENELDEDSAGIRVVVDINESNVQTYKMMLANKDVDDIPVELYCVSYSFFSGASVSFRYFPFKSLFIDTTRKEYSSLVDHFISDSIADNLTEDELTDLAVAYKASRRQFHDNDVVKKLNECVKKFFFN